MGFSADLKRRKLCGSKVVLVPYKPEHVPKYHEWMSDPEIQYLTASEPLTLEEEFDMQKKWVLDENKATFIILDRTAFEETKSEVASMIGDTNVFLIDKDTKVGEIEIMIAESSHRRQGKAKEALLMMMRFSVEILGLETFIAKIKFDNQASQVMFENLGFTETERSEIFREITYNFNINNEKYALMLNSNTNHLRYDLM